MALAQSAEMWALTLWTYMYAYIEIIMSSFNILPTMNWDVTVNIFKQGVLTQLDTLLDFHTLTFH